MNRPMDMDFTSDNFDGNSSLFVCDRAEAHSIIPPSRSMLPSLASIQNPAAAIRTPGAAPQSLFERTNKSDIPTPGIVHSLAMKVPENAKQLAGLLLDLESARKLLSSKLPLKHLRSILTGCYMQYYAVRESLKDPSSNFYIDKIIHVNRDGLRFKHCRDNSYRSIAKMKIPEFEFDQKCFALWISDMQQWHEPLPYTDVLASRLDLVKRTLASLPPELGEQNEGNNEKETNGGEASSNLIPACTLTRKELSKLVITVEEMVKLIDYGRDLFDRTVVGFYTQIRAPPSNVQKDKKPANEATSIFMDQIIGVSWATKPYILFQRPMAILLKFRHFRDERICQLPFWNKNEGITEDVFNQWKSDMQQWEEEYPSRDYIDQKASELTSILTDPPMGPPVDALRLAAIEAEREGSTKLLKKIQEWQEEHNDQPSYPPFPAVHQYPPRFPYAAHHPFRPPLFFRNPPSFPFIRPFPPRHMPRPFAPLPPTPAKAFGFFNQQIGSQGMQSQMFHRQQLEFPSHPNASKLHSSGTKKGTTVPKIRPLISKAHSSITKSKRQSLKAQPLLHANGFPMQMNPQLNYRFNPIHRSRYHGPAQF